jgi:50S ribosome-binding GTPase
VSANVNISVSIISVIVILIVRVSAYVFQLLLSLLYITQISLPHSQLIHTPHTTSHANPTQKHNHDDLGGYTLLPSSPFHTFPYLPHTLSPSTHSSILVFVFLSPLPLSLHPTSLSLSPPLIPLTLGGFAVHVASASTNWPVFAHLLPEIAFAGHSNCGKSTLVNSMVGVMAKKGPAATSNRAGWTDQICFYQVCSVSMQY